MAVWAIGKDLAKNSQGKTMELTAEASSELLMLIVFRLRRSQCRCDRTKRRDADSMCERCVRCAQLKKEFPLQYFAALEIVDRLGRLNTEATNGN